LLDALELDALEGVLEELELPDFLRMLVSGTDDVIFRIFEIFYLAELILWCLDMMK
jgi:hypothetical protein